MHGVRAQSIAAHRTTSSWIIFGVCICLALLSWAVFGQTLGYDFVNYDDPRYVYQNTRITNGLIAGIPWAFTHVHAENWHPFTTITHILDCQLYGLGAGGHHSTNVLLHTIGVILLFIVLRQMTGAFWQSAFVAALFAVHPLHVESVAWIAERKDVLSGVFFMLALLAYLRYARAPSTRRYFVVLGVFALGLMSKPMLVTVPFVLLLLDYWPLRRINLADAEKRGRTVLRLLLEKVPFLLLTIFSSVITFHVQQKGGAVSTVLTLGQRLGNASIS